jgi:C-terminal processing protease CtpA/Prc
MLNKLQLKFFTFLVLILIFSCQKPEQNINGVWIQEGYGRIISIKDSTYTYFNTTENSCLPLIEDGILKDRFQIINLKKDELILNPGGIVNYQFKRAKTLPEICLNQNRKPEHSPELNFNILWHTFDKHYAFFEERNINWNAVKAQSVEHLKTISSDKDLYNYFQNIIENFNDGHIKLDVPNTLLTSELNHEKKDPKKSKTELIQDISSTYINNMKRYNNGVIQWGILKNETIGYIAITDMNNFSNYVHDTTLSTIEFEQVYENVLNTKSGIQQLEDELNGVDFVMKKILSDLSKTRSIIIDLRFNGGGYETVALRLLSYFVKTPKHILSIKAKKGNQYTEPQEYILNPAKQNYQGQVAILTSHNTASAAEIFVLGTMAYPDIKRFGSSTNGVFSEMLWKNLPNGWEFSLSNEIYSDPYGKIYEILGVPPNFEIDYSKDRTNFYNSFYKRNQFKDTGIENIIKWNSSYN